MRIGLSMSSSLQSDHPGDAAGWMIERARAADAVELDSLTLGDQHAAASPYYQNTPMLGRLMAEWGQRPVGCLFLLPLWHPVLVAEQIGTLASLSRATFVVQTGIGAGPHRFAAFNADMATRGSVLEESVRVVKALLAGTPVESPLVGGPVEIGLRPAQMVEWWIGGGPARPGIERAARIGDAWYASPRPTPAEAAIELDVYLASCAQHGTDPRPIIRKDVVVAPDGAAAKARAADLVDRGYRGMSMEHVVAGDPQEVADRFAEYAELGFTDMICRCMGPDQRAALETIEQLGDVRARLT